MSDLHPDHVTPVLALEDQDACSPLVLRSAGLQAAKIIRKLTNDLGYREQEITRLRADLTQLERESDAEISALRACLAQAEADLAAAQEREQRMREALKPGLANLDALLNDHGYAEDGGLRGIVSELRATLGEPQ